MGKILGSWSGMRKYLEKDMLAESLKGRIRYGCTAYAGMDGCRVFEVCVDGAPVRRFSWETVNTYFIEQGYKGNSGDVRGYWAGFWPLLERYPIDRRTEYTDEEFCQALEAYRNQDIQESLRSGSPIVQMFAILDRRVGRRTLREIQGMMEERPEWLRWFYKLRLNAEKMGE